MAFSSARTLVATGHSETELRGGFVVVCDAKCMEVQSRWR